MKKITVSDSTLRLLSKKENGLSFKEKLEIAKRLSDSGVSVIEMPPVSLDKVDEVLIKTLSTTIKKNTLCCVAGNTEESLNKNYSLISGAKKKRILIQIPVSSVQMEYVFGKKPKFVLEHVENFTKKAVALCADVEVSFEDATRADISFLCEAIKIAVDSGAKTVTLTDLAGVLDNDGVKEFIGEIKDRVEELKTVNLNVSFSDEYSFGVSNCFSAIKSGVNGVKLCSVSGLENPCLYSFFKASEGLGAKNGFTTDLNKTALLAIVKEISSYVNKREGGFTKITSSEDNENINEITKSTLSKMLKVRGYYLSNDDLEKVYTEVLRISDKKQITAKELDVIIANTAMQVPETYSLVSFSVSSSNVLTATASITLKKDGKEISGLSYGNGPVDASFLALESITKKHFELDDFELGSVTEGKEAMGQAVVKLRSNGVIYSGRGVSTDIIGATIRAYINALNKIENGEKQV